MGDFWVFGYGSLMWNPGFAVIESKPATLYGLHRSLCIHSWVHRGTKEKPGLVLGLDRGGACRGLALRAAGTDREEIIEYLRERELVTAVYLECWRDVVISGSGERVSALVYRADRSHPQYAHGLTLDEQVRIVSNSMGKSGHNRDYVSNTVEAIASQGIRDAKLHYINEKLKASSVEAP